MDFLVNTLLEWILDFEYYKLELDPNLFNFGVAYYY